MSYAALVQPPTSKLCSMLATWGLAVCRAFCTRPLFLLLLLKLEEEDMLAVTNAFSFSTREVQSYITEVASG